jgi:hypothetical protein
MVPLCSHLRACCGLQAGQVGAAPQPSQAVQSIHLSAPAARRLRKSPGAKSNLASGDGARHSSLAGQVQAAPQPSQAVQGIHLSASAARRLRKSLGTKSNLASGDNACQSLLAGQVRASPQSYCFGHGVPFDWLICFNLGSTRFL